MTVYTYDDLRSLPDGWDGEPNSAIPSEPSIALLQALEPHVRSLGLPANPEPDASGGCGFSLDGEGPRYVWLHAHHSGRAMLAVFCGDMPPHGLSSVSRIDMSDPMPLLRTMAAWLKGEP